MQIVTLRALEKFKEKLKNNLGDSLPIGSIIPYSSNTIPDNYLICDGSAISRTTYAELFNIIGTTFGVGDGSTTFNLPNMNGRTLVGKDTTDANFDILGETLGEKTHTLTVNEMPEHSHRLATGLTEGTPLEKYRQWTFLNQTSGQVREPDGEYRVTEWVQNNGGSLSHNNIQPSIVVNYIIKVFNSLTLSSKILSSQTNSDKDTYSCNYINSKTQEATSDNPGLMSRSDKSKLDKIEGFFSVSKTSKDLTTLSFTINVASGSRACYFYTITHNGGFEPCSGILVREGPNIISNNMIFGTSTVSIVNDTLVFDLKRNWATVLIMTSDSYIS